MSAWTDLVERVRVLLFRGREERELAEELRFHVDMETDKNRRLGMSDDDARKRGLLALGGLETTKEKVRDARGTRLFLDTVGDLSMAIRSLRRSPGFAIVSILTLAIGIGATTAVFSAVDAVLLQPLPYQEPGQLVRLYQHEVGHLDNGFVTPVHFLAYRQQMSSLASTAALLTYSMTSADIGGSARPERIKLLPVSADYFDVVRVQPSIGRAFQTSDENGSHTVILSHSRWLRETNGDQNIVGHSFPMSGVPYTVAGVMPEGFVDPVAGSVDAWVPMDLSAGKDVSNVDNHYITVVARLRPNTPLSKAQAELDAVGVQLSTLYPDAKSERAHLLPLKEDLVGGSSRALSLLFGAVTLVLLLVCVNIANLLLVRGSERAREFALRTALGGQRARLVRQLLAESVTLAIAGALAGLIVARLTMSAIVVMGADAIPRLATLSLEPRLLLFSAVIASLSAIVFGLAPALRTTQAAPSDVLREQSRSSTGSRSQGRLRELLVVSQVALAFVLLSGAGVLTESFRRLQQLDLGVKTDRVLTFELQLPPVRYDTSARARFYEEFAAQAKQLPTIKAAGGISHLPATGPYHMWGTVATTGPLAGTKSARAQPIPQQRVVSANYFPAVGIRLIDGRLFDARDVLGTPRRVVISEMLARQLYPGVSAIGQQLRAGGRVAEIIGVVSDVALDVEGRRQSTVYHAHAQIASDRNWELTQVISTTDEPEQVIGAVRAILSRMDPQLVMYRPSTLAQAIGHGSASRTFMLRILTAFALTALALAALGLFGILSCSVKLRSREFGIRMALGANRNAIRGLVMQRGLVVTGVGVVFGLAGALALSRVMATMVFQVSPLDPFVLSGAVVFMAIVAAAAAFLPAYRATTVDPRAVLQGE